MRASRWLIAAGLAVLGACERYVAVGHEDAPLASAGASAGAEGEAGGAGGNAGGGGEAGAVVAVGGAAGAGGESGASAEPHWQADHETGTLEQWLQDGQGRAVRDGNGQIEVTRDRARSGEYALSVTISANDEMQNQGLLERDVQLAEGRYGAWYYLPEAMKTDYWVLMKLSNGSVNRFDIDIEVPSDGEPHLRLYEHDAGWITERATPVVPIGQWFHLEVLYRSTPNDDGRVIVLQDGEQVLDTGPRATAEDDRVVFAVGSSSRYVAPAPYRLFIDDASIDSASVP